MMHVPPVEAVLELAALHEEDNRQKRPSGLALSCEAFPSGGGDAGEHEVSGERRFSSSSAAPPLGVPLD